MGRRAPLTPLIVYPSSGESHLRCGKCGSLKFKVHVLPFNTEAKVTTVECDKCKKLFNLNPQGFLEGSGKVTTI